MLILIKAVLDLADAKKVAVGAFNITSPEGIQAVLGAVKELGQLAILQFVLVHESVTPLKVIEPVMAMMTEKPSVLVHVHPDHGDKLEILQEALEMGSASAIYNGSVLSFEENAADIEIVVETAGNRGASVETKLRAMGRQGSLSMGEGGEGETVESCHTDPEQARAFTALTGIDALTCSFGTAHRLHLTTPKLDSGGVHRVRENVGIPIVMHGGSGASDEDFEKCITNGVRKINYYTYLAEAGDMYIKERCTDVGEYVFSHDVTQQAVQITKEDMFHAIKVFSHLE